MAQPQDTRHISGSDDPNALSVPDGTLQPGQVLQSRYRVLGIIGMGGMGAVYQARDLRFDVTRLCAIKEMINMAKDQKLREQTMANFKREAEILATLDHPAIPKIYDYFGFGDRAYLVIEYIQGKDLEAYLNSTDELLDSEQVRQWSLEILDVLSYLHNYTPDPIVFRDLKPSNIMIDQHNRVRLIDFGIAKTFQMGQQGTMIGTEGYSPPEQYKGIATPQADIYALGATMHHLLTRRDPRLEPPFSFDQAPIRKFNPAVPEALENVVKRALSYNTEERYSSAEAMRQSLAAAAPGNVHASGVHQPPTRQPTNDMSPSLGGTPVGTPAPAPAPVPQQQVSTGANMVPQRSPIWAFKVEDAVRSTPIVRDGVVYVGSYDNNLWAINSSDGSLRWKYATEGGIGSSPTFAGGMIVIGSTDRRLHAVDARTGRLNWRFQTDGKIFTTPQAVAGLILFGSDDGKLYALRPKSINATEAWSYTAVAQIRSSPLVDVDNENIFFGTDAGDFVCLNFAGEMKWRFSSRRKIMSTPAQFENIIYFGSDDWYLYALDSTQGYPAWRFRTRGSIISSPAIGLGNVFFGSADGNVYAVDLYSGKETWKYEVGSQVTSSPAVYKDYLFIASVNGLLYAFHALSGELLWTFRSNGPILSSPHVVHDVLYIGSDDEHIYAIEAL